MECTSFSSSCSQLKGRNLYAKKHLLYLDSSPHPLPAQAGRTPVLLTSGWDWTLGGKKVHSSSGQSLNLPAIENNMFWFENKNCAPHEESKEKEADVCVCVVYIPTVLYWQKQTKMLFWGFMYLKKNQIQKKNTCFFLYPTFLYLTEF